MVELDFFERMLAPSFSRADLSDPVATACRLQSEAQNMHVRGSEETDSCASKLFPGYRWPALPAAMHMLPFGA